ncbi:RagB/SusD family nutrient uptake outer membrane protein [Pedobacter sp. P351]|uniref:RagB/SusD family nutrient uptake outer membrane protein n=1 Tax=Pedobacter superstes TaxID=3133441 RepID=UPI0030A58644
MKKIISKYIIIGSIGILINLSSCKDYLDYQSPSRLNVEQVYSSAEYTNTAILGIYNKAAGSRVYGNNLSISFPNGADDFWIRGSANYDVSGQGAISTYGESPTNQNLLNTFSQLYEGIERANLACKYIPSSDLYQKGAADVKLKMKRYYGEALALRALFYLELIRNWGDVPASFIPSADLESQFTTHANRDSTYDRILDDLKLASDLVGWRAEVPEYKTYRLTKAAIKALRARIALHRGGYSLRTDTKVMERKPDYEKYYRIAFDECNDIIKSKQHNLNPVYENVFKSLHSGTARFDNDANEIMFEIAMWGAINDSDLARTYGLQFTNTADPWGQGGGGAKAVPTYVYEFSGVNDSRRDVTLGFYEVRDGAMKRPVSLINLTCAKFRKSWTQFDKTSPSLQFGVNWPIVRYADVLLMFAEAANELQDFSGALTPLAALEQVQRRAFGSNPIPSPPAGKAAFFNAIVKERLLEFGGEGIRKYDLIRWNLLGTKIQEVRANILKIALNAPTENNSYANLSEFIYFKPAAFRNGKSSEEVASLDLYGGTPETVFYTRNTVNPGGAYSSVWWRRELGIWSNGVLTNPSIYSDSNTGYMLKFEPNKKELLPYPDRVITENRGGITQNFGWQ